MNDMQPSPLIRTSEELKYLPEEIDTEKDPLLIEWKDLRDCFFSPMRSICKCPNQVAKRESKGEFPEDLV